MSEFTIQLVVGGAVVGAVLSSYFTVKYIAWTTRTKRHARKDALQKIANHKWNIGEQNDAVVITRIALKGLAGE